MDFVTILEKHIAWRRGQGRAPELTPAAIGNAIETAAFEVKRLRAIETLVNNLIDQRGRYNTEQAYARLAEHMKTTKDTNDQG